ncbi:MAG: hypothetical protein K2Q26_00250 [Bdellovibrionales bacterium]|nr:hypothetical protein [Bdellovibrionales bacterium]
MKIKYIAFLVGLIFSFNAHAKLFSNSYVSFQLPPNWSCKVAGTEWVCRSSVGEDAKQAIIVLTAKEVGPNDNFAYYNQYLKSSKTPKNRDGTVATQSKIMHLKTVQIANHPWVDGLHLGSLLPNFYSRYLVTIKDKIAVLVTFNAKKEFYTKYSKHFFDAINSLRVTATSGTAGKNIKSANESLGNLDIDAHMEDGDWGDEDPNAMGLANQKKTSNVWLYGVFLILVGTAVFFLMFKKKK